MTSMFRIVLTVVVSSILLASLVLTSVSTIDGAASGSGSTYDSNQPLSGWSSVVPSLWSGMVGCFHCPTSDAYDPDCLEYALPPFPLCWLHPVDYFVTKAKDGAIRCCGVDRSHCRCPKKDTPAFVEKIDEWCLGIQACASDGTGGDDPRLGRPDGLIVARTTAGRHRGMVRPKQEEGDPTHHLLMWNHDGDNQDSNDAVDDRCPTSADYPERCLAKAMPPYPICTKMTVDEWVVQALQGHEHCCGDDGGTTEACLCPQKTSQTFVDKIADWCAGVETCSDGNAVMAVIDSRLI